VHPKCKALNDGCGALRRFSFDTEKPAASLNAAAAALDSVHLETARSCLESGKRPEVNEEYVRDRQKPE
jgi:hypothetical protein